MQQGVTLRCSTSSRSHCRLHKRRADDRLPEQKRTAYLAIVSLEAATDSDVGNPSTLLFFEVRTSSSDARSRTPLLWQICNIIPVVREVHMHNREQYRQRHGDIIACLKRAGAVSIRLSSRASSNVPTATIPHQQGRMLYANLTIGLSSCLRRTAPWTSLMMWQGVARYGSDTP